ncbi:MAG: hypothetical protein DDT26_00507 [Dehalococcoidia bacterium]|nr:hypothetical protein [Chloroflexota bacterium]
MVWPQRKEVQFDGYGGDFRGGHPYIDMMARDTECSTKQ